MSRAEAPAFRSGSQLLRMVIVAPSVMAPYFASQSACSIFTLDQSASSSSARIMGRDVRTPCPISERATINRISPSREIATNAFGTKSASAAPACEKPFVMWNATSSPAPPTELVFRKSRRDTLLAKLGDDALIGEYRRPCAAPSQFFGTQTWFR